MTSIITNRASLAAISVLQSITKNMDETEARVSSGLKVAKAADNSGYWSLATNLRSDNAVFSAVSDSLGLGVATMDTAYNGVDTAIKVLQEIKSNLVTARTPGIDKTKVGKEIETLKARLTSISQASSFNGENWLYNSASAAPGTKSVVASFNRDNAGAVSIGTILVDTSQTMLVDTNTANRGLLTKGLDVTQFSTATTSSTVSYFLIFANATTAATSPTAGVTPAEIKLTSTTTDFAVDGMLNAVESILRGLEANGTLLGASTSSAKIQDEFVKSLQATHLKGIGQLVDADMNEESTKLKALQTQQQLGLQALSIANSDAERLLVLFR